MKQKVYTVQNLDCANCAAKIEEKFNALPQVQEAVIVFPTRQLRLTAEDPDGLIPQLQRIAQSVESEVEILSAEAVHNCPTHAPEHGCCHEQADHCDCHDHHGSGHSHGPASKKVRGELSEILLGAAWFAVGVLCSLLGWEIPGFVAYVVAYLVLGRDVITAAARNLFKGRIFDENFLMSLATVGAFLIGEYPEAVGVMLFYRVGEYFEHRAMERSRSQIMEAVDLRPEVVNRLLDGEITVIAAGAAQVGDVLLVRPGDRIPLDGTVLSGESRLDTAPITGEPVPVAIKVGDSVTSGCVNLSGQLTIRVEKVLSESMVTRILNSVENAAASKPKIDRFITRFARIYTPVVVALAVAVAVIPSIVWGNWNYWIYTALSFLVMSCPCALVLSVPLAFFSGIGAGSRRGILFKGGLSIEVLAQIKAVVMDKTGTVTEGNFVVQRVEGKENTLALCAALEKYSSHPIAVSIMAAAGKQGISVPGAELTQELSGYGIVGLMNGKQLLCGNEKLMSRFGIALPKRDMDHGNTLVWVALDGELAGRICISDSIKPDARASVERLRALGMTTAILTGDKAPAARSVAENIGIGEVHAGLLPEEKLTRLQKIREQYGPTMFVGDGINDAPVLAGADVGAAMGSGADAAIEAADVVFMTSQTMAIPEALKIAHRTRRIAWQNVVFALAVKVVVMVLGLMGWASMWAAVFADSGVAMLCVLNAIGILYRKPGKM